MHLIFLTRLSTVCFRVTGALADGTSVQGREAERRLIQLWRPRGGGPTQSVCFRTGNNRRWRAPLLTALRREGRHAAERTLARDSHVADARPYAGEPARVRPRAVSPLRADVSSRRSVVEPTGSAPCPRAHRRLTLPSPRPQWLEPRYNTRTMCSPEEARGSSARSSSRTTDVRPRARPRSPSSRSRTLSISATKRWWPPTVSFPDAPLSTLPTLSTRADVVDDARVRLSRDPRTTQKADAFPAHPHALPSRPSPSRSRRGQSHPVPAPVGVRDLPHARRAARGVHGHGG